MGRLLVSLGLAFVMYGGGLSAPLLQALPEPELGMRGWPLVEASFRLDEWIASGALWGHRLGQVVLLGLVAWAASGALERSWRRGFVLLFVLFQPAMIGAVLDPAARGELLLALFGTLALTARGPLSGFWVLCALAAHPLAVLVPLIGVGWRKGQVWQWAALGLWCGLGAWLGGRWLLKGVGTSGFADGFAGAGPALGAYLADLLVPFEPVFWRSGSADLSLEAQAACVGLVAMALVCVWRWRGHPAVSQWGVRGMGVVVLPLLAAVLLIPGDAHISARLAWPVVGLAWLLVAVLPNARSVLLLVPLGLGISLLRLPGYATAESVWQRLHDRFPEDVPIHLRLASEVAQHDPERAVTMLEEVVSGQLEWSEELRLRRTLVGAYMSTDAPHAARPHLARIADPSDAGTIPEQILRCELAAELGDVVWDAERASVVAVCRGAVAAKADSPGMYAAAAVATFGAGEPHIARSYLVDAVQRWPDDLRMRQMLARVPLLDAQWHQSGPD